MPTEAKARDRRAAAMWEKVQGYLDPNTEFDTEVDSRTECMSSCALLLQTSFYSESFKNRPCSFC